MKYTTLRIAPHFPPHLATLLATLLPTRLPILLPILLAILLSTATAHAQLDIDTAAAITRNPNLYSLLVNRNNQTLCQRYFNGHRETDLMNDQSLTKSIVSLLIGIAIDKGKIKSLDQPIVDFFPELKTDSDKRKPQITIRQIMNQASGLYHENLEAPGGIPSYLNAPSQKDLVLHSPLNAEPGTTWHYSNAATHLLSVILTIATGTDTYTFAKTNLFDPLGIGTLEWMKMKDGYYDGCGLLSIRLRSEDMLKIGLLILHHGRYNDKQLVPAKYVDGILNPDKYYQTDWGFTQSTYALCYYHATVDGTAITYGMGWGGQFLVIIPGLNTVVVANENPADATAIRQSVTFTTKIFPLLLRLIATSPATTTHS
jgi:CubicO group peptidase (beta-lactamase class C family)